MDPRDTQKHGPPASQPSSSRHIEHPQPESRIPRHPNGRPHYMTVGHGSTSESAAHLQALIDDDSGYGGSAAHGNNGGGWHPGLTEDRPTPVHTPILPGENNAASEHERRTLNSLVLQQQYEQNKQMLAGSIHQTIETLRKFQAENQKWPAHYPSLQVEASTPHPVRSDPRPGIHHSFSSRNQHEWEAPSPPRPSGPRRAETSIGEDLSMAESSSASKPQPSAEPRLMNSQLARDFSVLKLELKMAGRNQTDLVHSLEKGSIASLLDNQIRESIRHLFSLQERIEDKSSKVLVTGDLNAGKSTFCNALLRRKVLPEDQQPCTSIFCEVRDARENSGIEEVHAVPLGAVYDRNDESSYEVFPLRKLESIVIDNEHYSMCKIYIKDGRSVDESLLNNGVVDIALIDAPGLNNDSVKTTAIFARQEEIDVVVFVVSAANHFTQSSREFIFNAAREKAYIFMVVNGFDNIRDKDRCEKNILSQIKQLSPATFKESTDLVHFVSSNAIPLLPGGGPGEDIASGGGGGGSGSGSGFGDPENNPDDEDDESEGKHGEPGLPDKGKGKEKEKLERFNDLEVQLRQFVLEKRARSKLAPAKTYLMNLLGDLNSLATVNRDVAESELARVKKELDELQPEYESSKKTRAEVGEELEQSLETYTSETYNHTREILHDSINRVSEQDLGIAYPGPFSALQYAEDIKDAMISEIAHTVHTCEEHARNKSIQGFNGIKQLGLFHVGNSYSDLRFVPEKMFRKRRHDLSRQVDIDFEFLDFFDVTNLWERQEKIAGTSMAVTVAGVIGGRMFGGFGWIDGALGAAKVMGTSNMRKILPLGLVLLASLGIGYAIQSIPQSLPRRLSNKLAAQLAAQDYVHDNASRISGEVRRALKGTAHELRIELQRGVEKLETKKEETTKLQLETEGAKRYFTNLVEHSTSISQRVERVDLENSPPGAMA